MRIVRLLPALLVCSTAFSTVPAEAPELENDEDKILYALGLVLSQSLAPFEFTEEELVTIQAGVSDGALDLAPRVVLEEFGPRIEEMLQARMGQITVREKEAGVTFRAEAAAEPGAVTTDSGLIYLELEAGDGAMPVATDTVKIHYHGTLRDGSVFDSSLEKEPATFRVGGVIRCFGEGLQKMKVGGKSKLTCPPEIAYGESGSPPRIRPGTTLVFELQLLEIVAPPDPAPIAP